MRCPVCRPGQPVCEEGKRLYQVVLRQVERLALPERIETLQDVERLVRFQAVVDGWLRHLGMDVVDREEVR